MILDLSQTDEWCSTSSEAIKQLFPTEVVGNVHRLDYEELYSDTMEYLLIALDDELMGTSLEELNQSFDDFFCSKYKQVKGFHGCRITNEMSYRKHGIRAMCPELLSELAMERFGNHCSAETIMEVCQKTKIDSYDNSVFFFPSIERAKEPSQNHYIKCGPEFLQGLSHNFGLANQGILSQQGDSCLIECNIPTRNITPMFRLSFWRDLITWSFQKAMGKKFESKAPDWGFASMIDIKPEQIQSFHYLKDSDYTYTLLKH